MLGFIERRTLGLSGLHDLRDARNRPIRQLRGAIAANFGYALLRTAANRHAPLGRVGAPSANAHVGSPPAEKATARQDQARQSGTRDGARNRSDMTL